MKNRRQERILELITQMDVETQEDLAALLNKEGFKVTQATISRDIRRLKLTKVSGGSGGKQKYISHGPEDGDEMQDKYIRILKDAYQSMDIAQNLLIIKTASGMAMAAAASIDNMKLAGIVGCIAGDDTIFCAISTDEQALLVRDRIKSLIAE